MAKHRSLFHITTIIALSLIYFGCSQKKADPFILSHLPNIQILEKQDHAFCSSLKIEFDKNDDLRSSLYWRCRLSLTKYRILTDNNSEQDIRHNLDVSDLITKISLKLSDTPESILVQQNKKMDSRQHQQCLAMGFIIATEDQAKIDDYFKCRKTLIEDQQLVPPYGNNDYFKYPNRSYNIGFVIDQRVDDDITRYKAAKEKYPTCTKFNLNNVNFKNCTAAQDRSRLCFSEIEKKKFQKEYEEKIACQKKSYIQFPDELLKDNDPRKKEIERMKTNSDFYNQHSLASLGLDDSQFKAEEQSVTNSDDTVEPNKKKKIAAAKRINSKAGLYDKFELTKLRQKYVISCQKEAGLRVTQYVESLKKFCEEAAKFEIIGEF